MSENEVVKCPHCNGTGKIEYNDKVFPCGRCDGKGEMIYPNPPFQKIEIKWCRVCGVWYIKCPRCGNNTCNAGYGEDLTKSDKKCEVCPTAYQLSDELHKNSKISEIINKLIDNGLAKPDDLDDIFETDEKEL